MQGRHIALAGNLGYDRPTSGACGAQLRLTGSRLRHGIELPQGVGAPATGAKDMEEAAVEGTSVLVTLIIWIVIGGVAGWLASSIVKGGGMGLVGNVVLGIVGAVVAGWLLPALGLGLGGGIIGAIIAAMIGAILILLVISLIKRA
jgi:uncharacterized membrane protein YeaQ/YmgE (transglycosylase-associated protein family)